MDDNDGPPRPIEIIGVVGNVQQLALDGEPTWDLYLAYSQIHADNVGAAAGNMFWIVRTTGDPMTLATSLAREVRRIDPEVVAAQIRPMDHYLSDAVAPRRFSLSLDCRVCSGGTSVGHHRYLCRCHVLGQPTSA